MSSRIFPQTAVVASCASLLIFQAACHKPQQRAEPPDARRPVVKTRAELAAERQEQIRSGRIVPTSAPSFDDGASLAADIAPSAAPILPGIGAIQSDILIVNKATITAAEVIYPLREQIREMRTAQTERGFQDWIVRTLRTQVQREIGSLLVYEEALAKLEKQQIEALDKYVDNELGERVAKEFGGRMARLDAHLAEYGLTLDTYKGWLKRDALVGQYSRDKLSPLVFIRRDELVAYYHRNASRFSNPESRELFIIEAPFANFLAEGVAWESADASAQAQARLRASRHIREAQEALGSRPFEDVAREFSRGLHADEGGAWGALAMPLKPPYDELSKLIFTYQEGQVSDPIETATGWYLVKCGAVQTAGQASFATVQDQLRDELRDRRFNELLSDYIIRLAEKATISSTDAFIQAAARKAATISPSETQMVEGTAPAAGPPRADAQPAKTSPSAATP